MFIKEIMMEHLFKSLHDAININKTMHILLTAYCLVVRELYDQYIKDELTNHNSRYM